MESSFSLQGAVVLLDRVSKIIEIIKNDNGKDTEVPKPQAVIHL